MLSTAREAILKMNPDADVQLFGQEVNPESYAICLADMMIKGQNANNIRFQDTMKKDSFEATVNNPEQKMRFVIMNPPFGQPWGGKDAADGVESAVNTEYKKGVKGRFGAGLPGTGDMQLLFMQHAISKLDNNGKAAIITNGSPLFSGGTSSGESQIRRFMIEQDLVEAIIALPTDLFYNTNIGIYIFILSKEGTKEKKRKGKIQLINATSEEFWTQLRKSLGKKRKEISAKQIEKIVKLYADFKENKYCKIFDKEEFLYREYAVYQPLQRNYAITEERIENMINSECLSNLYDQNKVEELQLLEPIPEKEKKQLDKILEGKPIYEEIIELLKNNITDRIYKKEKEFLPVIKEVLNSIDKKWIDKVIDGLSEMDKTAEIHRDKKGEIILDKTTKDTEIVKYNKDIKEYMDEEVLPHVPDAIYQFEEDLNAKKPIVKTGAEFLFSRYFYEYKAPSCSKALKNEFELIENQLNDKISKLFIDDENIATNMKESNIEWIEKIPEIWEIKHLKNVCKGFNNGTSDEQLQYGESDYPVSRIETISEGTINYEKVGYVEKENKKFLLHKNDFLISNINSIAYLGNCAMYNGDKTLYHGMNLLRIIPDDINPVFLKHYFKSISFRRNMQVVCKPAINQASVSSTNIKSMKLPIPPYKEQKEIANFLDEQTDKIDSVLEDLKNEIKILEDYKTSLIYEYITGKKRVKGAEELYG